MSSSIFVNIDGKKYICTVNLKEDDSGRWIVFALCDFYEIFMEKIRIEAILERWKAKDCNPFFSSLSEDFIISILKQEAVKYKFDESNENDSWKLETNYKKKDESTQKELSFKFFWMLKKCDSKHFGDHLTIPLMKTVIEQQLQIIELKKIIQAKDKEIENYKVAGAQLMIESLATEKFDEPNFSGKWNSFQQTKDKNFILKFNDLVNPELTDKTEAHKNLCSMLGIGDIFTEGALTTTMSPKKATVVKSPSGRNKKNARRYRGTYLPKKLPTKLDYADSGSSQELEPFDDVEIEMCPPDKIPKRKTKS